MFRAKLRTIVQAGGIVVAYCAVLALLIYPVIEAGGYFQA